MPWPTHSEASEMSWAGLVTTSQKLRQPHKATEMGLRPREAWPGQGEGATEAVRQVQVTRKTRERGSVSSPGVRIWVREGIAWHKNRGLGRPWGHRLRLRTAPKHRGQGTPAFPMFHTALPSQPEPRLGSFSTAQPCQDISSKGNRTCKNQGQSLLNSQPMHRFLLRAEHLLYDTGTTTEPS